MIYRSDWYNRLNSSLLLYTPSSLPPHSSKKKEKKKSKVKEKERKKEIKIDI